MSAAVLHAMDSPGAVGLLYGKRATTATALKYIASYERRARPIHRRYVLHVGLVEILRRTPEEIIDTLNASSADSVDGFAVCSIPDVATKGAEVRAAIQLANARIKKWCRRTHHRFIDLSRGWQDTMLEKDGLYSLEGASFVAAKIAQATLPFLGKRWKNQRKPDAPRAETPLVQQAPDNRSVGPMNASATTLHPAPPRSLAQRTPLLQFPQPTIQPQEGVPWTPAMETLQEPVQTLQAPPLPVSHLMPPPVSSGHHQMPASQVSSTVPSMHPRVPHSAAAVPTWGPIPPPIWNPQPGMPEVYSAVGAMNGRLPVTLPPPLPPLPWTRELQQLPPAVHNTVGDMVRQHLMLATRLPQ
ncbi:hypothetical protein HPB48_002313 [Haemaphysalis longicornis]|uniref:Uncharacterized protein n=1 Tax=Haemaphysalis longicornis TaxID=44386 RepID=A0A9J6GNX4_HAELO|nr:hypothetical protein HPB48_002313 [Haemaphysalis longicornis]